MDSVPSSSAAPRPQGPSEAEGEGTSREDLWHPWPCMEDKFFTVISAKTSAANSQKTNFKLRVTYNNKMTLTSFKAL